MAAIGAWFHDRATPYLLMLANAALFLTGAILHWGVQIGPLSEPRIVAATVVELICAVGLLAGALAPLYTRRGGWLGAVAANVVALAGIAIGVIALALGAGPRTLSNDVYHLVMALLALIALLHFAVAPPRRDE